MFERISSLIDQARSYVVNAVKIAEVKTRYEVGRYILEDEQQGERAKYGEQVLRQLSARLMDRYGEYKKLANKSLNRANRRFFGEESTAAAQGKYYSTLRGFIIAQLRKEGE